MLEKEIEAYAVRQAKRKGVITYKFSSPAMRGVPDRIFICNGRVWFREFKRPGGRPTKLQAMHLRKLEEAGCNVGVIDSKEAVDEMLDEIRG